MDLFIINRYNNSLDENTVDREEVHLQKLKLKIEERKRIHELNKKNIEDVSAEINQPINELRHENDATETKDTSEKNEIEIKKNKQNIDKKKTSTEFKVLGINEFQKKSTVRRILPHWLSHPHTISTSLQNLKCNVKDQDWLSSTLKSTLLSEGVSYLFPVQEKVIPFILSEHKSPYIFLPYDICVSAPTGSGKTLSFVLPIIQILMDDIGRHIRALIVLPVQELATQVFKVFKKYAARTSLKIALLSGSTPLRQEQKQIIRHTETLGWVSEVDIVVCTAGRLVEHLQNTEGFCLKHLKFLVIDEADRIMDHIQNDWLYHLDKFIKLENELMTGKSNSTSWNSLAKQRRPPHKLLFSATLSQDPEKLEQWSLFQPKLFSAAPSTNYEDEETKKYTTPEELDEKFIVCDMEEKPLILYHLLVEKQWNRVLCFTNSSEAAHRLTILLNAWSQGKLKVAELSAALDRNTRETVLKQFNQKEIDVLVGTDALARGIDIPICDYVISYDPPRNVKTYVHRIGRTGRAGRSGCAVTILLQNQVNIFKENIQMEANKELPCIEIPSDIYERLSESYERAINSTKNIISEEINNKVKKSVALKRPQKSNPNKRKPNQSSENDRKKIKKQ